MAVERWIEENFGDCNFGDDDLQPVEAILPCVDDTLVLLTEGLAEKEPENLVGAQADGFTSVVQDDRPPKLRRLLVFCESREKASFECSEMRRICHLEAELAEWKHLRAQLRLQILVERLLQAHYRQEMKAAHEIARVSSRERDC